MGSHFETGALVREVDLTQATRVCVILDLCSVIVIEVEMFAKLDNQANNIMAVIL